MYGLAIAAEVGTGLATALAGITGGLAGSGGNLKMGIIGALTAGTLHGVGNYFKNAANNALRNLSNVALRSLKVVAHGVVGGVSQVLAGGKFLRGFISAGFTQASSNIRGLYLKGRGINFRNSAIATTIGGTASVIGGGKFANGAITASCAYVAASAAQSASANSSRISPEVDRMMAADAVDLSRAVALDLQDVGDAVVGFGDTFGAGVIRDLIGIDSSSVNFDSPYYAGGGYAGTAVLTGAGLGVGARVAAYIGKVGGGTRWGHFLNHNRFLRFGPGRMPANGSLPAGPKVPRMSIGPQRSGINNPHADLRIRPFDR